MSIRFDILGKPGEDNALWLHLDTGQSTHQLLFDCGEACLMDKRISDIRAIEHLCFSHFHMDHVAGFDSFIRHTFNQGVNLGNEANTAVRVWGPRGTHDVVQHRLQGFTWNLVEAETGQWEITEIDSEGLHKIRLQTRDGFSTRSPRSSSPAASVIVKNKSYHIEAIRLPHGNIESIGYKVQEVSKRNVNLDKLDALKLQTGPWLGIVTGSNVPDDESIEIDGAHHRLGDLRETLVTETQGDSLAYLTDFNLDDSAQREAVIDWLAGTHTLICEAQYLEKDADLATQHGHMTTKKVGALARDAQVDRLVLQHISRRYNEVEWAEMLQEAQAEFPDTCFPYPDWICQSDS